jgi:Kef-type K+ transport system membrane component KefB
MRKEYKVSIIFVIVGLFLGIFLGCIITKLTPSTYLDIAILLLSPLTFVIVAVAIAVHCQDWGNTYEIIKITDIGNIS